MFTGQCMPGQKIPVHLSEHQIMNFSLDSRKYLVCTLNRNTPITPNEKNFSLDPTLFFSLTLRDAANRPQKFSKKLSPQKKKKPELQFRNAFTSHAQKLARRVKYALKTRLDAFPLHSKTWEQKKKVHGGKRLPKHAQHAAVPKQKLRMARTASLEHGTPQVCKSFSARSRRRLGHFSRATEAPQRFRVLFPSFY